MSDGKNDSKGGQGGSQSGNPGANQGSVPASKKPAPIIDLKATVVETAKAATDAAKDAVKDAAKVAAEPAKTVASAASDTTKSATATIAAINKPADTRATDPKATTKPVDVKSSDAKPAAKPTATPTSAPVAPAKSGGFFTHMAAGLTGAILAIGGSQFLDLGLGGAANVSPEVTRRLAALEQSATKPAAPGDTQKLAAAEARLARLEDAAKSLAEGQVKVVTEAKLIEERLAAQQPAGVADAAARVVKLEEQLAAMSAAAAADPRTAGRLPQWTC